MPSSSQSATDVHRIIKDVLVYGWDAFRCLHDVRPGDHLLSRVVWSCLPCARRRACYSSQDCLYESFVQTADTPGRARKQWGFFFLIFLFFFKYINNLYVNTRVSRASIAFWQRESHIKARSPFLFLLLRVKKKKKKGIEKKQQPQRTQSHSKVCQVTGMFLPEHCDERAWPHR